MTFPSFSLPLSAAFMPHGHCYLWTPSLLWLHVICDALIVLSYFSIPLGLVYFLRKRHDLTFGFVIGCFALFIVACGTTHLLEIWNVWHSAYWLSGGVKAVTALASVSTALLLIRLLPTAIALPSPAQLREANVALKEEIVTRQNAEERVRQLNAELERRVAEQTADLQRQHAELRMILDGVPALIFFKDREHRFVKVNAELTRLVGLPREEIEGRTDAELGSPEAARYAREEDEIFATGLPKRHRIEPLVTKRGVRWLQTDKVPQLDEAGRVVGIVGFALDVTERREAEKSASHFTAIVQSSFDAIISKDLHGIVTSWNAGAERMFGFSAEEMIGHSITQIIPPERLDDETGILALIRGGDRVEQFETLRKRKDGSLIDVSITVSPIKNTTGEIVGTSKVARDISERRKAEQAHLASEQRMRLATEATAVGIWEWNVATNRIHWDAQMFRIYGVPPTEDGMVDYSVWAGAVVAEELARQEELMRETLAKLSRGSREFRIRRGDESGYRSIAAVETVRTNAEGKGEWVVGTNLDITERKNAEKALRESEELFAKSFRLSPDCVSIVRASDRTLIQANDALCQLWGSTPEEVIGRRTLEYTTWQSEEERLAFMQTLTERGESLNYETKLAINDGRLLDFNISSRVITYNGESCFLTVMRDITDRKRTEKAVAASELRFRRLFETSNDGILILAAATGEVLDVNPFLTEILGFGRQEFLGKVIWELAFFRDVVASEANFSELRDQEYFQCQNMLLGTCDGQQIDVDFISNAYLVDDTEVIQFNVRDVTMRREAEHVIHQLNLELEQRVIERTAQLEAANKELEAFSYSVSHDLRAPLRTMDGFSQAVLEDFGPQLPEECQRYLKTIRKGAQRMGQLIDDLLTFARLSRAPLNRRAVNLTKLVEEIWNEHAPEREGRQVEWHASPLPECSGDPALLTQVWVNLLSNALKYSRTRDPAVIEIGSTQESGETVYFVRDNGTGFDMRYAHKLFGVFQRLHRAEEYEGTGVGLATVQRVIHRHGGRIWTESELNRGTTFYFTLPSHD